MSVTKLKLEKLLKNVKNIGSRLIYVHFIMKKILEFDLYLINYQYIFANGISICSKEHEEEKTVFNTNL